MKLKTYIAIAVPVFLLAAGWICFGPVHATVLGIWVVLAALAAFFVYAIGRLFMAIVGRLER